MQLAVSSVQNRRAREHLAELSRDLKRVEKVLAVLDRPTLPTVSGQTSAPKGRRRAVKIEY